MPTKVNTFKSRKLVESAIALNRAVQEANEKLELVKAELREMATDAANTACSDEQVEFPSEAGVVTVCFVRDATRIQKGAEPLTIRDKLSDEAWDKLFVTRAHLAPGFSDALAFMDARTKRIVGELVVTEPVEPRVKFPK